MSSSHHLLLGSLQPGVNDFLVPILSAQNYMVETASGREALLQRVKTPVDLVLLDLPSGDDLVLVREIREVVSEPIIVVGPARNDRLLIAVLEAGADDFVPRPFHINELLARIRAQIRRRSGNQIRTIQVGALHLDTRARQALLHGNLLPLSPSEYDLLVALAMQPGQRYHAAYLLTQVWGPRASQDFELLQITIHQLRRSIEVDPTTPQIICGDIKQGYWLAREPR